jgi:hypothetical protein
MYVLDEGTYIHLWLNYVDKNIAFNYFFHYLTRSNDAKVMRV